ncbi:DNA-invertase hin [Shewanella sp. P1-14-1]|uniref:recombinase family protein n=1 Tax=Shewanella sp. P1-14-1 TaxID=1723761 RepID=UPI0006D6543B|nr:recombinase family protein [Shewanella sp. P1-14-1]KPZ70239.1 DNA-invertase hin [Shewanella sp. P1-14-1]
MIINYIRISTVEQNIDRQQIDADKTYIDKVSGSATNRAELESLKDFARKGDVVTVHDISRLARNIKNLIELIDFFNDKGVDVQFRKEQMTFTADKKNPMNSLMLNLLGSVYQFEREMMLERQKEGIQKAQLKGKYSGRKSTVDYEAIKVELEQGLSIRKTAAKLGYSVATISRASKKMKETISGA